MRVKTLFPRRAVLDAFLGGLIDLLRSQKNDSFDPGSSAGGDSEGYGGRAHVIRHIHNAENILIGSAGISVIVSLIKLPPMRFFPISYAAARVMVPTTAKPVGIHLRPHDLRRHSAIYAVRPGVPARSPVT